MAADREDHITRRIIPATWRNEEPLLALQTAPRRAGLESQRIREIYKEYFVNEGQVPW